MGRTDAADAGARRPGGELGGPSAHGRGPAADPGRPGRRAGDGGAARPSRDRRGVHARARAVRQLRAYRARPALRCAAPHRRVPRACSPCTGGRWRSPTCRTRIRSRS